MISIIANKDDIISFGFYKAFKTLYKDVFFIAFPSQYHLMINSKIIIINNFDNIEEIIIKKEKKYVLLKKNELMEKKLKNLQITYYIIEEYINTKLYVDYDMKEKFMYMKENIIIMPFMSIYTKNEILYNYKNNILLKKEKNLNEEKMIMIKNRNKKELKKYNLPKLKIFNYINSIEEKKLISDINIFVSFSNPNKFDYKSLSYMSLGSLSLTNSLLNKIYIPKIISMNYKEDIKKFKEKFEKYQIKNIQEIYNNYTFEKYVKVLNKILN